jgi:hypothetical protein
MALAKKGCELPADTDVYLIRLKRNSVYAYKMQIWSFATTCDFIFDPSDGLWATINVRKHWKNNPHRHPHCSLFQLLNKKLEICT